MKIGYTRKLTLLLFVVASMVLLTPLVTGMATAKDTVIVQLSDDPAILTSTDTILENTPGAVVITYGSLKSDFILSSPINHLVVIGHGSSEGVLIQDDLTSWHNYADIINHMGAQEKILVTCESIRARDFLKSDNVFTFASAIDARLGGLVADFLIRQNKPSFNMVEAINDIITLNDDLVAEKIDPINLGLIGIGDPNPPPPPPPPPAHVLSTAERNYWLTKFLLVALSFIVGSFLLALSFVFIATLAFMAKAAYYIAWVLIEIDYFERGLLNSNGLSSKLLSFFLTAEEQGYTGYLRDYTPWYEWVLLGVALIATVTLMIVTAGASVAVKFYANLIIAITMLRYYAACFVSDAWDADPYVG